MGGRYMIFEVKIVTAHKTETFLQQLNNKIQWLKDKGFNLLVRHDLEHEVSIINLKIEGKQKDSIFREEDIICIFKHQLAEVVADHIVTNWQSKLVWREILKNYKKLSAEEKEIVFSKASEFVSKCNSNESRNLLMNFGRKNRIAYKVLEHLNHNDKLVVEGFVNFCIPDYLTEVRFAVELAMEELKDEKEYNEFIKLLRYFVDTQPPKVFEVNLILDADGFFYLLDGGGTRIDDDYIHYYLDDMIGDEINFDDVLISILITLSPRNIILHNTTNIPLNEAIRIIKTVFQDKIKICPGCEHCMKHKGKVEITHYQSERE